MTRFKQDESGHAGENEDPEDVVERERRERSVGRMRRVAAVAGWISLFAVASPFLLAPLGSLIDSAGLGDPALLFGLVALAVVGPIFAMIDLGLVVRLRWLGEGDLVVLTFLGLPGALISVMIVLLILGERGVVTL